MITDLPGANFVSPFAACLTLPRGDNLPEFKDFGEKLKIVI